MPISDEQAKITDRALQQWKQGDAVLGGNLTFFHQASLTRPTTDSAIAARQQVEDDGDAIPDIPLAIENVVEGLIVVSQTCDIVRDCKFAPFVDVAPLIRVDEDVLSEVRKERRPKRAFVPGLEDRNFVADLTRVMTVEKGIVASWERIEGCRSDDEIRNFARTVSRKYDRFAFPDDFNEIAIVGLETLMKNRSGKQSDEGKHVDALQEVRVRAAPDWDADVVSLHLWFIRDDEPMPCEPNWNHWLEGWIDTVDQTGRFRVVGWSAVRLEDMTALDYLVV